MGNGLTEVHKNANQTFHKHTQLDSSLQCKVVCMRERETERDRERQRESNEILKIKCEEYSLQWLDSLNHVDFKFPVVLFIYLLNDPSLHLLIQSQQRKYQNSVLNLYKMKSITSFW